jgi:FKBP-type peptidyl-prolyl cis-trans isomerase (trigger factor)
MSENKKYKILDKKGPENSILTLEVEIDKEFVSSFREDTISDLKKDVEIDGFRKGNAPDEKVIEISGDLKIWEKNTFKAINVIVPVILQDEEVNTITMPNISVTKLAPDQAPQVKVELTLMPEVEIADYKKIAGGIAKPKKEDSEATDKEVEDYINYIRENRAHAGHDHKPGEKCDAKVPELDDEFVKSLGDFKSVDDFKKQMKENLSRDKKMNADQKRRIEIMEAIIKESKIDIPEVLIAEEQERMLHEFKAKVEGFKMNFEDYLKEIKKTEEELKKEWKVDAEKRSKMNLVLPKIAREEKIVADPKKIEDEVKHLKSHHPEIDDNVAKVYVTNVLTNQAVFDYLDSI